MSTKLDRPPKKNTKSALLAVSGGVDSITLLNILARELSSSAPPGHSNRLTQLIHDFALETGLTDIELAYTDHQQRRSTDTNLDIKAILVLAKKFDLKLHIVTLDLPKDTSEQLAREKRYQALRKIQQERGLDHIITAHHADDVLETALINLTRGTGPKGLSSLRHQEEGIWRPFLYRFKDGIYITKQDIFKYAKAEDLTWHEDHTNTSDRYLRNRIRQKLELQAPSQKQELLDLVSTNLSLNQAISVATSLIEVGLEAGPDQTYSIESFKKLPEEVKDQFLHAKISQNGFDVNKKSVLMAKEFVQNKTTGKVLQLKGCEISIPSKGSFQFVSLNKS